MRCPQCLFEATIVQGRCTRCGYDTAQGGLSPSGGRAATPFPPTPGIPNQFILMRGDTLGKGRYRIEKQIYLPEPQQRQGGAWSAVDTHFSHRRVVIREMRPPEEMLRATHPDQIAYTAAHRLTEIGKHPGFPEVIGFFKDRNSHFIVFLYPEGERLASLLVQEGGALPEPIVAEHGYQLCGLLAVLADQKPPFVHGSINPDTIIISDDGQQVSLVHLPLFPPDSPSTNAGKMSSGYYAPEQVRGSASPSSDLYAVAAIMHHAVTGYDPQTRLAFFHPPVRRLNPAVTAQMEKILARQLLLSVTQRYAHPLEMQQDLAALIDSYPESSNTMSPTPAADPLNLTTAQRLEKSRSTHLLNIGVLAAIGVLLLLGVLFAVLRP